MKEITAAAMGLTFAALTASAQTINYSQIPHIHTSLDHLTVVELGEPITTVAVANPDALSVEHHGDKVFLKPTRQQESTNLFIWTATRQLAYEVDPAGDVSKMNVVVGAIPSNHVAVRTQAKAEPDDTEINRIAGLVLTRAMLGSQDIVRDDTKLASGRVDVALQQVFRAADATYIRYSISNRTNHPYRLTTPDVMALLPTQIPQTLASLKNHQLRPSLADNFRAKAGQPLTVVSAESSARDVAPGETVTGVVSVKNAQTNPPQLFQVQFGTDTTRPVTADTVL
jgi:Conjugal transfer protein